MLCFPGAGRDWVNSRVPILASFFFNFFPFFNFLIFFLKLSCGCDMSIFIVGSLINVVVI